MSCVLPSRLVRLTLLALCAITGCATFSDNGVVARVGDEDLTGDDLVELIQGGGNTPESTDSGSASTLPAPDRVTGDEARGAVSFWVQERIILGSALAGSYADDPASLGVACLDVAIVDDAASGEALVERLTGGEDWDEVVAPIEAEFGYDSQQPCAGLADYAGQFGPEFADAISALDPSSDPTLVDAGAGGLVVVRIQDFETAFEAGVFNVLQQTSPDAIQELSDSIGRLDVYVDPRYGRFDAELVEVVAVD
jgi:hypothetical protein